MTIQPSNYSSSSGTSTTASQSSQSAKDLNDKYNNFLLLLTKQLQNQDPLSPLDTNQFTQQLVAFSSVEQAIQSNQRLDRLIALQSNNNAYGAASFIGRQVAYEDDRIQLKGSEARFAYQLAQNSDKAILSITDSAGRLVSTKLVDPSAGTHQLNWDGKDDNGQTLPDGVYRLAVSGLDKEGKASQAIITGLGKVDGASLVGDKIELFIGGINIPIDQVKQIGNN